MKITYTIPFKGLIVIDDHWEVPMQGGRLRVIDKNGYARAIELIFDKQPLEYAPRVQHHAEGRAAMTITSRDLRMMFMKRQLDDAITFLECIHDIELAIDEIEAKYEGETPEEEAQIAIKSSSTGRHSSALSLPFDMLTRAIMVAEKRDGPRFEATLASTARRALAQEEFINSFRYSFLLIESLYGAGQFKTSGLKTSLKGSQEFRDIVEFALKDLIPARSDHSSDTAKLLAMKPSADDMIDHLVEKRGFYFHGNIKRKDAWRPEEQGAAEALALFTICIANQIAVKAADPLFEAELEKRHFEDAMRVGAEIVFQVRFKYREPGEKFDRAHQIEISMPGTKPTPRTAFMVAQRFLHLFNHNQPVSDLVSVECVVEGTDQKVFYMTFSVAKDASVQN